MMVKTVQNISYVVGGYTQVYDPNFIPDVIYLKPSGIHGMTGTISLSTSSSPSEGFSWKVILFPSTTVAPTITLFGLNITYPATTGGSNFSPTFVYDFWVDANGVIQNTQTVYDTQTIQQIDGQTLMDNSVVTSKIVNGTNPGDILMVSGGNTWAETTVSGNVLISNTGVTTIQSGVIINSMVNSTAAIALTKLAALSPSGVCVTNGSGFITTNTSLPTNLGGLGANFGSSTGFITLNSGTANVGSAKFSRDLNVSFTPSGVGDFKIMMAGGGTIVEIYAFVEYPLGAATATIAPKNNVGTTMGTGTINLGSSDTKGTAYTSTPSTNNSFVDGDILTFTTSGGGNQGVVHLSIIYTKNS